MVQRSTPANDSPEASSSVQKACRILRAMSDVRNARLTDIATASALDKATVLRLLEVLARNGFVQRHPVSKRYTLGPEVFVLGAAAAARSDPRPVVRPSLARLLDQFEDSVVFSIPRGVESVCADVQVGTFAIRANYLEVGSRRPLGVGAGSLALLAWLPDEEIEALMPLIEPRLARYPRLSTGLIREFVDTSRRKGYAMQLDVVIERMGGIAVPILGEDGRPLGAISIAALNERITSRESELVAALQREAQVCQLAWRQGASRAFD